MTVRKGLVILMGLVLVGIAAFAFPAAARTEECETFDVSTEQVGPDVFLTYDSSLLCDDAPDKGDYEFTLMVSNAASSGEGATIDALQLTQTTPRPLGQQPDATGQAAGLPVSVSPGSTERVTVSGSYALVETDEGKKATIHFRAQGTEASTNQPFALGINVHFTGSGVTEGARDPDGSRPQTGVTREGDATRVPAERPAKSDGDEAKLTTISGTLAVCGDEWCVADIEVDFGPPWYLSDEKAPVDHDGDGTDETLAVEIAGLRGQAVSLKVEFGLFGDADAFAVNGVFYRKEIGPPPWAGPPDNAGPSE